MDKDEKGIKDVKLLIGEKEVITNEEGQYALKVKAKKVQIAVIVDSIPNGFVFSTPMAGAIDIIHHKSQRVDFGLTTTSGIYGIVYFDANQSGKPDTGDEFINKTKIILDGTQEEWTDFEGTYFFKGIGPGEHKITLDVNSMPIEYIPLIKLINTVNVEEGTTYVFHIPLKKGKEKGK